MTSQVIISVANSACEEEQLKAASELAERYGYTLKKIETNKNPEELTPAEMGVLAFRNSKRFK